MGKNFMKSTQRLMGTIKLGVIKPTLGADSSAAY